MSSSSSSLQSLLLLLGCCLLLSASAAEFGATRELLLSKKQRKEIAEAERRDDVLEAHNIQQAALNREQEAMLRFGTEEALSVVRKYNKASSHKKRVALFTELWENAEGVTVVKAMGMLINLSPRKAKQVYAVVSDSMQSAEDNGYSFKVSEGLYNAMAVTDPENDHYHLLDALLYRMGEKNKEKKGSGCEYIEFLFSDAEIWALDDGRSQKFFQGFDNKEYVSIMECFLPECTGSAAKCCASRQAVSTGMCGCKVTNKKLNTVQCEHNLFWSAPRTIWLCSKSSCEDDEKCLCAKPGSSRTKNRKTSKGKEVEEKKKSSKKKTSEKEKSSKAKKEKEDEPDKKDTKKKSASKTETSKKSSKTEKETKSVKKEPAKSTKTSKAKKEPKSAAELEIDTKPKRKARKPAPKEKKKEVETSPKRGSKTTSKKHDKQQKSSTTRSKST